MVYYKVGELSKNQNFSLFNLADYVAKHWKGRGENLEQFSVSSPRKAPISYNEIAMKRTSPKNSDFQQLAIKCNIEHVRDYVFNLSSFLKAYCFEEFLLEVVKPCGLQPSDRLKILESNINQDLADSNEEEASCYLSPESFREPIINEELFFELEAHCVVILI